jgi:type IV secretion system protein VirB5
MNHRGTTMNIWLSRISVSAFLASTAAAAQGVPVIDISAIAHQLEQLVEARNQLQALQQQITQAQQLYASVNQLTNMGDIASALNNPAIRRALPSDFASAERALMGTGNGSFGTNASTERAANEVYTRPLGDNDFYATEVKRTQNANAGQISVGQGMYEAASKRIDGLEELRAQIGQADSAAAKADLGNRIQLESAMLQADMLRMQGLAMVQQAHIKVQDQRGRERFDQKIDEGLQSLGASPAATASQ